MSLTALYYLFYLYYSIYTIYSIYRNRNAPNVSLGSQTYIFTGGKRHLLISSLLRTVLVKLGVSSYTECFLAFKKRIIWIFINT